MKVFDFAERRKSAGQVRSRLRALLQGHPHLDSWVRRHLWSRISHPEPELAFLARSRWQFNVAVDVGAADGVYTFTLLRMSKHVVAIEPNPESLESLRWLNRSRRCTVYPFAAGSESKVAELRVPDEGRYGSSLRTENWTSKSMTSTSVFCVRLDDLLQDTIQRFGAVDFLKVDVEGFELDVLKGGEETISQFRPLILAEVEFRHTHLVSQTFEHLATRGYVPHLLHADERWRITSLEEVQDQQASPEKRFQKNFSLQGLPAYANNILFVPSEKPLPA